MKFKRNYKQSNAIIKRIKLKNNVKTRYTTKRLYTDYQDFIKSAPSELKDYLRKERELYGISEINDDIYHSRKIPTKEKRFMIAREIGLITGEYQEARKNTFIENYAIALRDKGVSKKKVNYITSTLRSLSPAELALHIKANTLPNAFIIYQSEASESDISAFEDDIDNFIDNLTDFSNDDDLTFNEIEK